MGDSADRAWPRFARAALAVVLVVVALGGTAPYFEALLDANERPRLLAGIALVEEGSVRVDGPWSAGVGLGPDLARGSDGALVPNKPPGATLVASAAYLITRGPDGAVSLRRYTIAARLLGGLLPTLLLAALMWRREREWAAYRSEGTIAGGPDPSAAAAATPVDLAVLCWLLATPAWANAKLLFGHSLAACLLGVGMLVIAGRPARALERSPAFAAGLAMGAAVLVEYTAAFAGPVIGLWLIWRERHRWPVIAAALAGALIPIVALAAYHAAVFGSPWTTGYHRAVNHGFAAIHGRGLLGLQLPSATSLYEHLLSPWGGLLVWAPLCLLGLLAGVHAAVGGTTGPSVTAPGLPAPGLPATSGSPATPVPPATPSPSSRSPACAALSVAVTRGRARHALFAGVGIALLLVLLGLEQGGGWRVGPRYYVLAMPLCIPGLVALLRACQRAERGLAVTLVFGLAAAGTAANFMAANWFPHLIPHGNPLADLLAPLIGTGRRPHGLPPLLVGASALGLWGWASARWSRYASAPRWAYASAAVLGAMLFAAQLLGPASDPLAALEREAIGRMWEPDADGRSPPSRTLSPRGSRSSP